MIAVKLPDRKENKQIKQSRVNHTSGWIAQVNGIGWGIRPDELIDDEPV